MGEPEGRLLLDVGDRETPKRSPLPTASRISPPVSGMPTSRIPAAAIASMP
jgi:hypothetical protein